MWNWVIPNEDIIYTGLMKGIATLYNTQCHHIYIFLKTLNSPISKMVADRNKIPADFNSGFHSSTLTKVSSFLNACHTTFISNIPLRTGAKIDVPCKDKCRAHRYDYSHCFITLLLCLNLTFGNRHMS